MKALLKTIGILIGIVIVLFIAAVVIISVYFHPNDYKDEIAAIVQEKTGRELEIEGDIVLSAFPWLAVELGKLELGNAPGFPDEKFLRLEKMEIGVKLLPLFSKRLEMRTVTVHGLELNLAKDKDGQTNWADLAALQSSADEKKAEEDKPSEDGGKEGGLPIAALGIGGLDIRDAALRWRDDQSGQAYRLEGLAIETGSIVPEASGALAITDPLDIAISFDVQGNPPPIEGHMETRGKLTADLGANTYRLSGLKMFTRLSGEPIPNGKMTLDLAGDISADLAEQTLRVENLRLATGQIHANGAIAIDRLLESPAFHGKIRMESFNPRALLAELGQPVPETTDPKALTSATLSMSVRGTTDRVRLESLTGRLDDTTLDGAVTVANFPAPAIGFDIHLDAIDADRYLPPSEAEAGKPAAPATPGTAASGAGQLPLEALRALNMDGKARLGKLTLANLHFSDLALDVKAKGGVIRLSPIEMALYEGNYAGNIGMDARGDELRITLDEKLSGVQAGPLLRDLRGDDLLSGQVRFALDLQAVGATPEGFKKTLNGNTDFTFSDGMVKGIDIIHTLCNAAGKVSGEAAEGTPFQELAGRLPVTDGRVGINESLRLQAPLLRIQGVSGEIDIGADRFDNVKFLVKPAFTCEGQGGKSLDALTGAEIPVTCNGPMANPKSCLPDAEALAAIVVGVLADEKVEAIKEKIEEEVQKAVSEKLGGQLGDKLSEELGGEFKKLFGR